MRSRELCLAGALLLAACEGGGTTSDAGPGVDAPAIDAPMIDAGPPPEPRADYGTAGPHAVGHTRTTITDRTGMRELPLELWYPAVESARAEAEAGHPLIGFEDEGTPTYDALVPVIAAAPATCIRGTVHAARDSEPLDLPSFPAVVLSHCHSCTRFELAEVAERLASHGIVVAAPDHVGNTVWQELEGTSAMVGDEFLAVRVSDVSSVLDRLLAADATELPEGLRGRIDAEHVAVMGHSFGSATTGAVVSSDDRFVAAVGLAAPIDIFGGVRIATLTTPYLLVVAREDNSITEGGNLLIRQNFTRLRSPAWLMEIEDAGHWSFSDICGLIDDFDAGCGMGVRQTMRDVPFTYLENALARDIVADAVAGFLAVYLLEDPGGATFLSRPHESGRTTVMSHP